MSRRHRNKGGSGASFVRVDRYLLQTPAWRALSGSAAKAYLTLAARYSGGNNGDLSLSVREVCELCGFARATAQKALSELQEKGFVRLRQRGSFSTKVRNASTWALTCWGVDTATPTKEFMQWRPPPKRGKRTRAPSIVSDARRAQPEPAIA